MKNKFNVICLSLKNNILPALIVLFIVCLIIFSKQNLSATQNGLLLWANSVVPALLPFFIATELLSHTKVVSFIGKFLNKYMKPIFNVPGIGAYAFIMGIISGYPVGAKIVTKFREDGTCSKAEAERLLAFTNNSGPLFIIGTVGISLFGNSTIGLLLYLTHFLACIIVGFLFRFWKYNDNEKVVYKTSNETSNKYISFSNLGEILASSIMNAIHTIIMIGGFVIIFSVIISILNSSGVLYLFSNILSPLFKSLRLNVEYIKPIISGLVELTNGLSNIVTINTKSISITITLTSFLLGFGGLSILLQVLSITSKSDISIKPYIIGKFLHGIIAALLTYAFMHIFPIFNLDLAPVFSQNVNNLPIYSNTNLYNFLIFFIFLILATLLFANMKKHKSYKH